MILPFKKGNLVKFSYKDFPERWIVAVLLNIEIKEEFECDYDSYVKFFILKRSKKAYGYITIGNKLIVEEYIFKNEIKVLK